MKKTHFTGFILVFILLNSITLFSQSLNSPESIVYDAHNKRYLISNAGNGTILARSLSGSYSYFASGLGSPKGMVILSGKLYVTDVTKIVTYSLLTNKKISSTTINGSSFLNDITSDNSTTLFVSDMNKNYIYKINANNMKYSILTSTGISSPNGLLYDDVNSRLILCSFKSNAPIQAINPSTGSVSTITTTSLSNLDGLARDDSGYVYVSSWGSNSVYRFNAKFTTGPTLFSSGYNGPADIYYNPEAKVLAIPSMTNSQLFFEDLLSAPIMANGDTTICPGTSVKLSSVSGSALKFLWKRNGINVSAASSYDASKPGSYAVTITNHLGSKTSSSLNISLLPQPSKPLISAQGPTSFCHGDSVILSGPSGYTYLWSDNQTDRQIIVKNTSKFTLHVIDSNNCKSPISDTVAVVSGPSVLKPVVSILGNDTFCEGDSIILFGPSGFNYLWSNGDKTDSIVVRTDLSVSLTITDTNNCSSFPSDTFVTTMLNKPQQPNINFSGNSEFCEGDSIILSAPKGFTSYLWNDSDTARIKVVRKSTSLQLAVIDSNLCKSDFSNPVKTTVFALPEKPVINAPGKTEFCYGDSIILSAPKGFTSYLWNDSDTARTKVVRKSTSLLLAVIDSNLCKSDFSNAVKITVFPLPEKPIIKASANIEFCEGDSVVLSTDTNFSAYFWSPSGSEAQIIVRQNGKYSVRVEDSNGCLSPYSDIVSIVVNPIPDKPTILFTSPDILKSSIEGDDYKWFFEGNEMNEKTRSIQVSDEGNYEVIVVENNCFSEISEPYNFKHSGIDQDGFSKLVVYPNPVKDQLIIEFLDPVNNNTRVYLYDMPGRLIESTKIIEDLKGTFRLNTSSIPKGTYILKIIGTNINLSKKIIKN